MEETCPGSIGCRVLRSHCSAILSLFPSNRPPLLSCCLIFRPPISHAWLTSALVASAVSCLSVGQYTLVTIAFRRLLPSLSKCNIRQASRRTLWNLPRDRFRNGASRDISFHFLTVSASDQGFYQGLIIHKPALRESTPDFSFENTLKFEILPPEFYFSPQISKVWKITCMIQTSEGTIAVLA